MARKLKVTEKHRQVARDLSKGVSDRQALLRAGYSESAAHKGMEKLKQEIPALAQAIYEQGIQGVREFNAQQGQRLGKEEKVQLVDGVLIRNALHGEGEAKGSTFAAKTLGQTRAVSMFEPDLQVGVFSMEVPPEWKDRYLGTEAQAKEQPVDPLPPAEEKYLNGIPIHTTEDAIRNLQRQKALTESPATPPQESKQATIGDADTPGLTPAPEPTGEPQQET